MLLLCMFFSSLLHLDTNKPATPFSKASKSRNNVIKKRNAEKRHVFGKPNAFKWPISKPAVSKFFVWRNRPTALR